MLQGRYIEHQALRAFGQTERITSVTSFRPKHSSFRDDSVLTTVRAISDLSELYSQFAEYRLQMLEERVREQLKILRESQKVAGKFSTQAMKDFLTEQEKFIAHTNQEMILDEEVKKGLILQEPLEATADKGGKRLKRKMEE